MTRTGAVTRRYPNSRTKSNVELLSRLNRLDWAVVSARRYGVDIVSQRHGDHWSHFPLRAMQNDLLHIQVLLIQGQTCLPEVGHLNYHQAAQESNYLTILHSALWSCCYYRWNRWSLSCWFLLLKTQMYGVAISYGDGHVIYCVIPL